jgi:hypothetical protein
MEAMAPVSGRRLSTALFLGALPALVALATEPSILAHNAFLLAGLGIVVAGISIFLFKGGPMRTATPSWPLLVLLALLPVGIGAVALDGPVTNDEESYLFQAQLFSQGQATEALSPEPAALFRRQVFEDSEAGVRFSKYPPGASIGLALGTWLGSPRIAVFFAALLDLILLAGICRTLGLRKPGTAVLLFALAPFHLLVHTSFQSEVFTVPGILAGYWALLALRNSPKTSLLLAVAVGASAGWVFLCRPLTGVVFAVACFPALLLRRGGLQSTLGAVLGGLPFLLGLLAWQAARTGDPWTSPYHLYAAAFGPWDPSLLREGIRVPLDVYGKGDFISGLLGQAARWSVAWGGILGAAALGFWGLARLRSSDGWAGLSLSIGLPLAYAFHWYPGHWGYLGPLYAFESLALLTLGLVFLLEKAPSGWARGLPMAALGLGCVLFLSSLAPLAEHSQMRASPASTAAEQAPNDAVVLLPWSPNPILQERSMKTWVPSPWPFKEGEAVLVREFGDLSATRTALQELGLGGRPLFRFVPGGENSSPGLERVQRPGEATSPKE